MTSVLLYVDEHGWWRADALETYCAGRGRTKQDALFQVLLALEESRRQWAPDAWRTESVIELKVEDLDVIEIPTRLTRAFLETQF